MKRATYVDLERGAAPPQPHTSGGRRLYVDENDNLQVRKRDGAIATPGWDLVVDEDGSSLNGWTNIGQGEWVTEDGWIKPPTLVGEGEESRLVYSAPIVGCYAVVELEAQVQDPEHQVLYLDFGDPGTGGQLNGLSAASISISFENGGGFSNGNGAFFTQLGIGAPFAVGNTFSLPGTDANPWALVLRGGAGDFTPAWCRTIKIWTLALPV